MKPDQQMLDRDPVQEKALEAAVHKAAEDALVYGTGVIRATDLGVEHVPPERLHQQRDPVQEAVERAYQAWLTTLPRPNDDLRAYIRGFVTAALAPYGGLEAIKRLEEGK